MDIVGGRETVRRAIAEILTPNLTPTNATITHESLLTLARCRSGRFRLVTTNFDHIFEEVIERKGFVVEGFKAPLLPVPKNRWDGLVYLHGLLPKSSALTSSGLDRIVVSSGDFGLAYLTERWAARFVSELFRNYTVCFVGYSINDPVLRYMMDALAADRLLGESPPEMFAFGSYTKGMEAKRADEWRAKNVTPILYRQDKSHSILHKTLREWARTYRDGVRGKEMIIAQHAITPPLAPSRSDFAVGRVLWALTDVSAAKHFADLNPVPPLEWLGPLTEAQFGHDDLSRFGVAPTAERNKKLSFCIVSRPTPYTLAPKMSIADIGACGSNWDDVMFQIARWLTRHLNDPKVLLWLAKLGGQLHERFVQLVRSRIEALHRLEQEGKQEELKCISEAAPNAIPGPLMRTLWRMFLSGRVKSQSHGHDLYDWLHRFKHDGITPTLRMELREILTPRVTLRERIRWSDESTDSGTPEHIRDILDWELALSADHVHSVLHDLQNSTAWKGALPEMLPDFNVLLRDSLDLMRELGGADDHSDLSYFAQPSIGEHPQNNDFHDWSALIILLRDAWLDTVKTNPTRAKHYVDGWWDTPYPLFKRLTFFAAANTEIVTCKEAVDWLLAENHWWLWSVETQREAIRLLVVLAPKLDAIAQERLEQAILQGPPREMFRDDIDPDEWKSLVDHEIWLRLAKVHATGAELGQYSNAKLCEIRLLNPLWSIGADEREEFPYWSCGGDERRKYVTTPRRRRGLMEFLTKPIHEYLQVDDWHQRCREDFPTTICALCGLAQKGQWPVDRWRVALQAWAEDKLLKRSWRYMARLINQMPEDILQTLSHGLSWWLRAQSKVFEGQEELYFSLIRRLLAVEYEELDETDDPVSRAINHPIGHATEAMLNWWYRHEPKDSQGIKGDVRLVFTLLCDTSFCNFRHGRVVLAAHTISLFRVDEEWTRIYLLPLFDWQKSNEAHAVWGGVLGSPRLYRPLLRGCKKVCVNGHYG